MRSLYAEKYPWLRGVSIGCRGIRAQGKTALVGGENSATIHRRWIPLFGIGFEKNSAEDSVGVHFLLHTEE